MPILPPSPVPLPTVAVVAPAPALKQARGGQKIRTETLQAVDGMEKADRTRPRSRRRDRRGENLDILV